MGMYGWEERSAQGFWGKAGETDHLEDVVVGGDNIKTNLQVAGWGGVEWLDLDQDTGRWRTVVNAVINLRVL